MGIKVTMVGCGAVVQRLYKTPLQRLEKRGVIDVVALVDKDRLRAEALQRVFKKASVYDDVANAVGNTRSQLTIVASPAAVHAEHAILAMQNHSHVLCEKPMAVTNAQCERMNETARNAGLKLSIGMMRRYFPSLARAKRLLEAGALGSLLSFTYREGRQYNWPVADAESLQKKGGGGGILLDMGAHAFDTLMWMFGKLRIVSHFDDCLNSGIEASCITNLEFEGKSGFVHLSWDYELVNRLEILGNRARIIVSLDGIDKICGTTNDGTCLALPHVDFPVSLNDSKRDRSTPRNVRDCIYMNIVQMLRAMLRNEKPGADGDDGLAVLSVIEECYQVAQPMDMTWLPEDQNNTFKVLHGS